MAGQDSSVALQVSPLLQLLCVASRAALLPVWTLLHANLTRMGLSQGLRHCHIHDGMLCLLFNRRQQRLRADSYRALRLLDLALTSWSSVWAEGQEFAQKAAFFLAGRQSELQVLVLRAWGPEAARLRLKREHLEM